MSLFGKCFLTSGLIMQALVFYLYGGSVISLISGLCGIVAVVLCAQRYSTQFFFSFAQLFTYVWLAWQQRFYGELVENVFYFLMTSLAVYTWLTHSKDGKVESRSLGKLTNVIVFAINAIFSYILYIILKKTNDTQPLVDAIDTVPAFIAQILLTFRYREQWIYWGILDVASIFMWLKCGDYCMATQFVYWTINCIYGYYLWKRTS